MKVSQYGALFGVTAVVGGIVVATTLANAQTPPPPGPAQQRPGVGMAMQGMANFEVINDATAIYVVRPDRIIRVDKGTMRISGETALPGMGMGGGMRPGGPGGSFGGGAGGGG